MFTDVCAGTVGGFIVTLIGHPFDTLKTRLQTAPLGFYQNTRDCVKKTIQGEGASGFYRGVYSPLYGQMLFRACSFGTFYPTVSFLQKQGNVVASKLSYNQLLVAGGFTGFVIAFIETPIDLIKTKLQVQIFQSQINPQYTPKYLNVGECVRYIIHNHGITSMWRGLSGTIIRNIPANSLYFPVYEISKDFLAAREGIDVRDISLGKKLFSGAVAGLSYWVCTYPLDVVKATMQSNEAYSAKGWLHTAKSIWETGGIRAFSRGLLPCALRAVPACGCMFATVDVIRSKLSNH